VLVVVDFVVPEDGLVAITPEVVLNPDILIWVLWALLQWEFMLPVLPMFIPKVVSVDTGKNEARNRDVDGQLAPEFTGLSSVFLHGFSLLQEVVACLGREAA